MFTGIVTAVGTVQSAHMQDGVRELRIGSPYDGLTPGESIAVNGACLTVERVDGNTFQVQAVAATLERTGIGAYSAGRQVNLERALRLGDRLGGHLVQGHVDGLGVIHAMTQHGAEMQMELDLPAAVAALTVVRGSLTVDGVSLTVNAMPSPHRARVALVPFTLQHTTLAGMRTGDTVHLEADIIGRYVQALLDGRSGSA